MMARLVIKVGKERPSRRREVGDERYVNRHVDHDLFVDNVEFRINSLELEASLYGCLFPVRIH
jgi:hypothetical protein